MRVINSDLVAGYDIGGTKADVLVRDTHTGRIVFSRRYPSGDFSSLDELLDQTLSEQQYSIGGHPARVTLAIAGPRRANGDVQMTNQGWPLFEATKTAERLVGVDIQTTNDMAATAAGLATLNLEEQKLLKAGAANAGGPKLVITASTGVGDATLLADGTPVASEGGHTTWQPMTELEYCYLQFLRAKHAVDTVTVESSIGGLYGFDNLYYFLTNEVGYVPSPVVRRQVEVCRQAGEGIGRVITEHVIEELDPLCCLIMEVFGSILGQHTRNRAVGTVASGGIFFVGSVMQPAVASYIIRYTTFLERFVAEGAQHAEMMKAIPVYVVTDGAVAVKGALELSMRH